MAQEQEKSIIRGVLELYAGNNQKDLNLLLEYRKKLHDRGDYFMSSDDLTVEVEGSDTLLFDTEGSGETLVCDSEYKVSKRYNIEDFSGTFNELLENYRSGDFDDNDTAMREFIQLADNLSEKVPLRSSQFNNDIHEGEGYYHLIPKFWSDTLNADNEPIATLNWVEEYSGVSELEALIADIEVCGYRYFGSLNEAATWAICSVEECRKVFDTMHGAYPSIHDYKYHTEFTPEELDAIIDTLKLNYDI